MSKLSKMLYELTLRRSVREGGVKVQVTSSCLTQIGVMSPLQDLHVSNLQGCKSSQHRNLIDK